ncbi:MAG: hypothetical protein ACO3ZG_08780 [Kiritimatiellia bacterium]
MRILLFIGLIMPGVSIHAEASAKPYADSPHYQSVLNAHHILITGEGDIDVSYAEARHLFLQENILDAVQQAYARLLDNGEKSEFVIEQHGDRRWSYVNKADQYSEIIELHRHIEEGEPAELILYAAGERFFGNFRAVIKIHVQEIDATSCRYGVTVYAYPENSFSRFFARHLGIAERFFRHKTKEITDLTVRICKALVAA